MELIKKISFNILLVIVSLIGAAVVFAASQAFSQTAPVVVPSIDRTQWVGFMGDLAVELEFMGCSFSPCAPGFGDLFGNVVGDPIAMLGVYRQNGQLINFRFNNQQNFEPLGLLELDGDVLSVKGGFIFMRRPPQ